MARVSSEELERLKKDVSLERLVTARGRNRRGRRKRNGEFFGS